MRRFILIALFLLSCPNWMLGQTNKPSTLPDPIKYLNRFEVVWNAAHDVLNDMELKIELEDRASGRITTKPYEFVSGTVAVSELDKVSTYDGLNSAWLKGRYSLELLMEIVQPNETSVTVHTKIEGLKQDLTGGKAWVERRSNGTIERRVLGKLSMKLLAPNKTESKKGFWDQPPQPVLKPKEDPRAIPSPARDRP